MRGKGTSAASCSELEESLMEDTEINYLVHQACVRKYRAEAMKDQEQ